MPGSPTENRPVGHVAGHRDTVVGQVEQAHRRGSRATITISARGQLRQQVAHDQQHGERAGADGQRGEAGVGDCLERAPELLQVGAARRRHAEQLVGLVDDDADREAEHEAAHHGLGQERRDPAHPQQPERHVDAAGRRARGRRRTAQRRSCPAPPAPTRGAITAAETAHDRGARSLGDVPRGAEDGVPDQRRERGVEAVLHRDADQGRVGQALRHQQRPDGEPGDRVGGQRSRGGRPAASPGSGRGDAADRSCSPTLPRRSSPARSQPQGAGASPPVGERRPQAAGRSSSGISPCTWPDSVSSTVSSPAT